MNDYLKAPFPWFGGKATVADEVWRRFGKTDRYIEPFFGSGAMLLANPHWQDTFEVVNDLDNHVANCWRSLKYDADTVASARTRSTFTRTTMRFSGRTRTRR